MPDASRPTGVALVPPPAMFLLPLLFGLWLNSRFPIGRVPASASRPLEWLGVALIAAGLAHVLPSIALFLSKRTTIIPHQHASTFVRGGAYRWTRNPMYVGLALIYTGICALTAAVWPLLFLPMPLLLIDRVIIPMEERHMEEAFGADYVSYKARVRRWL